MHYSDFGKKVNGEAGILQLMDDLGNALADKPPLAMFGGGNPAQIPAVTELFKQSLLAISHDEQKLAAMLGNYDAPRGNASFITTVKDFVNRHYDLGITEDNIAITSGSQTGYFMLFNILAGKSGTTQKRILFPLVPEYIGYVDQALESDSFTSLRPKIHKIGDHEFKYGIDFENLKITDDIAGMCLSRPTNPTGNVVTDSELEHLSTLATTHDIPLIIDNAYGLPFPGVITADIKPIWSDHIVWSLSLSKVGLPSSRVGIFIGPKQLMKTLASANAIVSLASPSLGQYIAEPLIKNDAILELSDTHIKPYYFERAARMRKLIEKHFPKNLPWRLHLFEGSYFFWLWLEGSKLTSKALYDYLKERSVLVVPSEYFFPGQTTEDWPHAHECIRLNFARPDTELEQGVPILAEAIIQAYR